MGGWMSVVDGVMKWDGGWVGGFGWWVKRSLVGVLLNRRMIGGGGMGDLVVW